jgi:hypothetical protein
MTIGSRSGARRAGPQGTWLAFLALAIQSLLPFLVAYEIALASTPAHAQDTSVLCSASASPSSSNATIDHTTHHGLIGSCPICMALAASHAFTAAAPVALPLPQPAQVIQRYMARVPHAFADAAASYNPRAPPFIA